MPVKLLLQLSWRNLWRHRRRNTILLVAIAVAVAGVLLLNSLLRGVQLNMKDSVIDNLTGHVKVLQPGYLDDPGIAHGFEVARDWDVGVDPDAIVGWTSRIRVPAVIMSERETRGVQLVGVDPARESISFLDSIVIDGEALASPDDRRVTRRRGARRATRDQGRPTPRVDHARRRRPQSRGGVPDRRHLPRRSGRA